MAREDVPLNVARRQLGRANLGLTSVPLQNDVQLLAVGQLIAATGFSSQFTDRYEIDIRGPQDLAQPVK